MIKTRSKKKLRTSRAQLRELKSRRRRRKWLKAKQRRLQGLTPYQKEYKLARTKAHVAKVPDIFCIQKYPNEVFKFISLLKGLKNKSRVKAVFISMRDCTEISNGVIALVISAIKELKLSDIKVSGNYPIDKATRSTLEKSGFFNFVIGNILEENKTTLNTILQQGTDVVDPVLVAPLVTKAMSVVWGQPFRNPRVQSLLVELMANTVNHAFKSTKKSKWYISMSVDQAKKIVSFTFIDNGQGINATLNLKFSEKIKIFLLNSSEEIVAAAFDGKFGSRTKERKRGRGLPNIKKCFTENYISNLIVITNDVYHSFESGTSRRLSNPFDGTCYYWELDLNCASWKIL